MKQPHRNTAKTTFLGVYALSRPSKRRALAVPYPAGSSNAVVAVQAARPEDCNNDNANRKRKRTPSDGSSDSLSSSGHSFDPRSLVNLKEPASPSTTAAGHLHLHESLKSVPVDNTADAACATIQEDHSPHASTSKLPYSAQDPSSGPSPLAEKADLTPPQTAANTTVAQRKGKGRQLYIPCIEIEEKRVDLPRRAVSSGPIANLPQTRKVAPSEEADHRAASASQRASSARPSSYAPKIHGRLEPDKGYYAAEPLEPNVDTQSERPRQDRVHSRPSYTPLAISPSLCIEDFLASSIAPSMSTAAASVPGSEAADASNIPGSALEPVGARFSFSKETTGAKGEAIGEKADPTLCPAESPSARSGSPLRNPSSDPNEGQPPTLNKPVCISSSEDEQQDKMLVDGQESDIPQAYSVSSATEQEIAAQASQTSAGSAKKSVKFAIEEHAEAHSVGRRSPLSRRARMTARRRKRTSQEFFVGEAEDYLPSDLEDQSDGSRNALRSTTSATTVIGSSSPLTPLSSSTSRSSAISPNNPDLMGFLRSFSRSSAAGSERGNMDRTSGGRNIARTVVESDCSDDDGEVPLRRLKARRSSPLTKQVRQMIPDNASVRPARSRKVSSHASTSSTSVTEKRAASRTLFTRSRSTGENADCRQCHRCEIYQPQSKTLRCMTCEQAVCSACLITHYAGHPSYVATLAYLQIDPMSNMPNEHIDVSQIDFRCPVCKHLCRCTTCPRGPLPVKKIAAPPLPSQAELPSPVRSESMRRADSLLSSDADLEPLHWPSLVRGTSTRPNLKARLRVGRSAPASRLSKSAQQSMRHSDASSNAYYDLQDAIASEAARRAQVDAETDFVPVVSSRQSRRSLPSSPQQGFSSTSQTASSDSNESDMVQVASTRRSRPTLSARVRLATKVGQQLGKSPAYVESRRSPRREGDQLIPYNNNEPVLTLAPDPIAQDTDTQDAQPASSSENPSLDELAAIVGDIEGNAYDETVANELLESLLELPDTELGGVEEIADIPPLEEPALGEVDHLSPSDTVTTASVSSLASPPANGERSVKFDLSGTHLPSTGLQANDTSHNSIFLPGIVEDDLVFPFSSPSFTPTRQSRFLQNPTSPSSNFKALASPYLVTSNLDQNQHAMHDFLYSSPSRHTAFDIDLMPEFAFDNLIPA